MDVLVLDDALLEAFPLMTASGVLDQLHNQTTARAKQLGEELDRWSQLRATINTWEIQTWPWPSRTKISPYTERLYNAIDGHRVIGGHRVWGDGWGWAPARRYRAIDVLRTPEAYVPYEDRSWLVAGPSGAAVALPPSLAHSVVPSLAYTFWLDPSWNLRKGLLRLVDGIRAVLWLRLVLVLAALSRRSDALRFVLIVLAASRCYGRRGDPDHYVLPAHRSMSVIVGDAARAA